MKNSGVCPKCAARDIVCVPGKTSNLVVPRPNVIPVGWVGGVLVARFVCCGCGFTEEWVECAAALQKIKAQFGAVGRDAASDQG